jgi:hypothetical protein
MTLFHCCSPFSCSWDFQNSFFPRGCHKAYHPACVEKDRDFLNSDEEFICGKHFIVLCLIFLWAPIIVVKMHVTVPGTILAYWKLAYLIICHYLPFSSSPIGLNIVWPFLFFFYFLLWVSYMRDCNMQLNIRKSDFWEREIFKFLGSQLIGQMHKWVNF